MINLHATKKLQTKLPVDKSGCLPNVREQSNPGTWPTENPLNNWHANLLILQRRNCILLVHDTTRFPLFIPCLTKPDFANLNWWFEDALMNTLLKCDASEQQLEAAHRLLAPLQVDSICDRSVQGTMNQMKANLEHMVWHRQVDVADLSGRQTGVWLADRPCNVKGQKDCIWPIQAMLALLGGVPSPEKVSAPNFQDNVISIKGISHD